ncbi:MAG: alanine racemase [Hyphomonas sp. BRH_c22]|nr:MAG: alanine racemase [Hyphomonas sp. BRH_c22]
MVEISQADESSIVINLERVRERIELACARAGRDPSEVTLLPVTKTVGAPRLREAIRVGLTNFGENKVQEAREKADLLTDIDVRWSIIGHLQTSKAKYVARFAHEFQALDRLGIAEALQRRLDIENRTLDVFVQINASGEDSKFGIPPEGASALVKALAPYDRLHLKGLMTLAVFSGEEARARECFKIMCRAQDRLRDAIIEGQSVDALSMGMSGDFEWAIAEGATVLRIGQAIFGARSIPDSHYWPES